MRIEMPVDGWGFKDGKPIIPRRWQSLAMPEIIKHYNKPNPTRGVIFAGTGSGKSILIGQFCACIKCEPNEVIVISTSRQRLVRQIRKTIEDRIESDEFMAPSMVGAYFADQKDGLDNRKIIVACNDSLLALAEALSKRGLRTAFYICDELHRSESAKMKAAYNALLPVMSIGLSATPYRANAKHGISNFDEVIYKYTIQEALDDKVIVSWIVKNWEGGETDLDTACITMLKEETDGCAIVNAVSVADAEVFAKKATDSGYPTKAVHSKKSDKENEEIIEELRAGQIMAVCHIDTMTEGADLPFLACLCMRRVVGSRNRFVQELGRGIRCFTNPVTGREKTHLTILDPHDLMSVHKMTHSAVLSGDFDPDDEEAQEDSEKSDGKRIERSLQQECFSVMRHLSEVKAGKAPLDSQPLASYLSQLCSVFDTFGLMEKSIVSREWRRAPASQKQITTMQNMKWSLGRKQVPPIHKTALEILTGHGTTMTRGIASDLISIEMSLAKNSTWPKFSQLDQCAKDGLDRHEKKKSGLSKTKAVANSNLIRNPEAKLEQGVLFDGTIGGKKK